MTHKILLIGAGAIGSRHLQALKRLSGPDYALWVVEPSLQSWEKAQALWDGLKPDNLPGVAPALCRVERVTELPEEPFDVAIVATQANVRARVTEELLEARSVKNLILEKVLFQRLSEYGYIAQILERNAIACWVNCPRRMWPGYKQLKAELSGLVLQSFEITGGGWDLGCNGVHFIDLFAFLSDAKDVFVDEVRYEGPPKAAKRAGGVHISGVATGRLKLANGAMATFFAQSADQPLGDKVIEIAIGDGRTVRVEEEMAQMRWSFNPEDASSWCSAPVKFQSVLSDKAVIDIVQTGTCDLTPYKDSAIHHLALLRAFCGGIGQFVPDLEPGYCPIT